MGKVKCSGARPCERCIRRNDVCSDSTTESYVSVPEESVLRTREMLQKSVAPNLTCRYLHKLQRQAARASHGCSACVGPSSPIANATTANSIPEATTASSSSVDTRHEAVDRTPVPLPVLLEQREYQIISIRESDRHIVDVLPVTSSDTQAPEDDITSPCNPLLSAGSSYKSDDKGRHRMHYCWSHEETKS